VVAPGFTVTEDNLARFPDEVREQVRERTPSGRLSAPEDVAAAVVFLGSPANTRHHRIINGGHPACWPAPRRSHQPGHDLRLEYK
jgi:NAD(P)-dependent dehydrogenase (short-subunit alcohol dehydrogenase family)